MKDKYNKKPRTPFYLSSTGSTFIGGDGNGGTDEAGDNMAFVIPLSVAVAALPTLFVKPASRVVDCSRFGGTTGLLGGIGGGTPRPPINVNAIGLFFIVLDDTTCAGTIAGGIEQPEKFADVGAATVACIGCCC